MKSDAKDPNGHNWHLPEHELGLGGLRSGLCCLRCGCAYESGDAKRTCPGRTRKLSEVIAQRAGR